MNFWFSDMSGLPCPVCGKINTSETGAPFPADSSRFVRYCFQLKIEPKATNKKAFICYEHFNPKDYIKSGGKIIGIAKSAIPLKVMQVWF